MINIEIAFVNSFFNFSKIFTTAGLLFTGWAAPWTSVLCSAVWTGADSGAVLFVAGEPTPVRMRRTKRLRCSIHSIRAQSTEGQSAARPANSNAAGVITSTCEFPVYCDNTYWSLLFRSTAYSHAQSDYSLCRFPHVPHNRPRLPAACPNR